MVDINIRAAVLHNIHGNNQDQLKETIVDAITSGEEVMLPGLGVLMEVAWKNAGADLQGQILSTIEKGVQ